MFDFHKIKKEGPKVCLFLYINKDYEFSFEFLFGKPKKRKKQKKENLHDIVNNYISDHKINVKGNKVYLILNQYLIKTKIFKLKNLFVMIE